MGKNVCFCAENTRFCRTGEATIYVIMHNIYNQNKSLAPMDNFVNHFSAGFIFILCYF